MSKQRDEEQYCSSDLLQLKLMSEPLWAVFLWLTIKQVPSSDSPYAYGYLPKEWELWVIKPSTFGPYLTIELHGSQAADDKKLPRVKFDELSLLRHETLQKPALWNDDEETFLASPKEWQRFALEMPHGSDMVAIVREGATGGKYETVDNPKNWPKVVSAPAASVIKKIGPLIKQVNQTCDRFWEAKPKLSREEYQCGTKGAPRNLCLTLVKEKSHELVLRPVLTDPTIPHDACEQPWEARTWRLGWRPLGSGTQELEPVTSHPIPDTIQTMVAMLEKACQRYETKKIGRVSSFYDQKSWF